MLKKIILIMLGMGYTFSFAQYTLVLKKQRPPQLDISNYKNVIVGDIVGPSGEKTEQSLDLTDVLTAKLFNARTLEVTDRNELDKILGSQRYKDLQVINEPTKQLLNKKFTGAIFISGRIQSVELRQELIYINQSVVVNGCDKRYYYQVKDNVVIQLKILDLKSGKMIFSDAVSVLVDKKTAENCQVPNKLDLTAIRRNATKDLADEISKLIVPYEVGTALNFSNPGLLKSAFKELDDAVKYLELGNPNEGLAILKGYAESNSVKDKFKDDAWFNYGLGLLYANKNDDAKFSLQKCAALNSANSNVVSELIKIIEDDAIADRKMAEIAALKQKQAQEIPQDAGANKAVITPSKNVVKNKKGKS